MMLLGIEPVTFRLVWQCRNPTAPPALCFGGGGIAQVMMVEVGILSDVPHIVKTTESYTEIQL